MAIRLVIVTDVRLFGEGLAQALQPEASVEVAGVVQNFDRLCQRLRNYAAEIALLDVTGGIDLDEVRLLAVERPDMKLLALGLQEQRAEVIRCARAGFSGYISRDIPFPRLVPLLNEVARGGAHCSAEITAGLMRAVFRPDLDLAAPATGSPLTRRESEILQLLGRGFSNKEIARDLSLSAATVKNHVHNLLAKLKMSRRIDAARCLRDRPWIAGPSP